eukprot:Rmarinus@m.7873
MDILTMDKEKPTKESLCLDETRRLIQDVIDGWGMRYKTSIKYVGRDGTDLRFDCYCSDPTPADPVVPYYVVIHFVARNVTDISKLRLEYTLEQERQVRVVGIHMFNEQWVERAIDLRRHVSVQRSILA